MNEEEVTVVRRYAKPVVVADDLTLLHGRTTGVVKLPRHLEWSGSADYDLDSPGRIVDLYRTVLIEATKADDLHAFLDLTVLTQLWPSLWLPPDLRRAWEERFPELRRTDSGVTAA
ncbi:hypothetical protein AB0F81_14765 [Actinoplanes sp. NPDC024001]|uniref:hypothetical protein n=1 Tax=Actinoplanes sp. NPDC024001 TaxID=3154598 RepID=UPI0033FEC80A